jgi:4-hydroxy-tetrahydrodipicolinate synthase
LIEHVLTGGVHGIFLLGTTGEAVALPRTVRRELIHRAAEVINKRVPVFAGVCDNSLTDSLRWANECAELGADAVVLSTPSFLPAEQSEIGRFVATFGHESPLPVMLYNMPRLTSHWMSIDTIREALQIDKIIGLKDSSGDMTYFAEVRRCLAARPDWSLFVGPEVLLADAIKLGANGCVGGGSNLWPELFVDIYEAAVEQDHLRLEVLQGTLQELGAIYQFGGYATGVIRGLKCALEVLGICNARMAAPFALCTTAQREAIERQLLKLGLLVGKANRIAQQPSRAGTHLE